MPIIHADGPPISAVSRAQAESKLRSNPHFASATEIDLWESPEGRWVAAAYVAAGPPFGGPADEAEEAPGPKSEGPDDTEPAPDEGGPDGPSEDSEKPDDEGSDKDGPPKDEKDKGKEKGGDEHLLHEVFDGLQKIMLALGINDGGPEDSPVPGADEPMGPPDGPPAGPPHGGPPGAGGPDQEVKHERAMKPGEAPPGTTPVGAPAFASISDDHPWKSMIGKVASFKVEESWPQDRPVEDFERYAREVASGTGFEVRQTKRSVKEDTGEPSVKALVVKSR